MANSACMTAFADSAAQNPANPTIQDFVLSAEETDTYENGFGIKD